MSTTVSVGKRQLSAELICEHVSRSHLLPQLLREIIIDEALSGWQPDSPAELADGQAAIEQYYQQISALAIERGMNHASIMKAAERTVKLQQFKQGIWGNKLGSYYLERKSQLDRVICSVMQLQDGSICQELFFRVKSDRKSFAKLAIKYSQGMAAIDGGKLGPIAIASLHPDIARQVAQLQPGQLSPIFIIGNTYTFVRLEELIPAPFDDRLRQLLLDELFEKWLQERISSEIGLISLATDFIPPNFMTSSQHAIEEQTPDGVKLLFPVAPNLQDPKPEQPILERGDTGLLLSQLDAIANSPALPTAIAPHPTSPPEQFVLERGDTGLLLSQLDAIANSPELPTAIAPHPTPPPEQFVLERGDTGLLLSQLDAIANSPAPKPDNLAISNANSAPEQPILGQGDTGLLLSLLDDIANQLDVDLSTPAIDSDMLSLSTPELRTMATSSSDSSSGFFFPQILTPAPITYVSDLDREFDRYKSIAILAIIFATLVLGIGAVYQLNSTRLTNPIQQPSQK